MSSVVYVEPGAGSVDLRYLIDRVGSPEEQRYGFRDRIEIGRAQPQVSGAAALLLMEDPTVSRRHCVITRGRDGRVYVRDLSRNGTRVDGRRLVPNVEFELKPGQTVSVGRGHSFVFLEEAERETDDKPSGVATFAVRAATPATVLVGDIRDYTVLVREVDTESVQRSVSRIFELLGHEVERLGGTVKEYPGDALFAFWESESLSGAAVPACRAALELHGRACELARDPAVWRISDRVLHMDWALATGMVAVESFGGAHPTGLSMVGEPVVLAFRLEKHASDETGPIVACPQTARVAGSQFQFRSLGQFHAKGFDSPDTVYALVGQGDAAGRNSSAPLEGRA
jgi:class 3 adenylate cyclase